MGVVQGAVEPGFEPVREVFEQQFASGQHFGAGVSAYHRGRKVVDLWGGLADADASTPWLEDTMVPCYSVTKGLTAMALHVLADRGLVKYDDLVSKYWPEFAANGKSGITIYHLLTHQAGIPQLPDMARIDDLCDWQKMIHGIEQLTPEWEPGTNSGYHALNFGYLVSEVVRRIDGRSVGTFFHDEIAAPLGMTQIYIGTPEALDSKVATLKSTIPVTPEGEQMRKAFVASGAITVRAMGMGLPGDMSAMMSTPAGHRAEIPAINGIMSARDLARMYACLAGYGEIDGVRILSERTVRAMSERQTHRPDLVIIVPVGWSLGYMNGGDPGWPQGPRVTSFGHPGAGGAVGFADPEIGLSFGLVLNGLSQDFVGTGRGATLANAARACAENA